MALQIGSIINSPSVSAIPVIGTGLAVVDTLYDAVTSLFGKSPKDIQNDKFVDSLVTATQKIGYTGFTHDDVVHLLPANWGTDRNNAIQIFQTYLDIGAGNGLGVGGLRITSYGQNIAPALNFGGGYKPNHVITYLPPTANYNTNAIDLNTNENGITTNNNNNVNNSSTGQSTSKQNNNMIYIVIGSIALILFILIYSKGV